jgi:NADH:ubiquinone oxidoreductase subunit H
MIDAFILKLLLPWLLINVPFSQLVIFLIMKLVCILLAVAYFTIAERKAMAAIQRRRGPNVVGF